jgi:hypothetical protein
MNQALTMGVTIGETIGTIETNKEMPESTSAMIAVLDKWNSRPATRFSMPASWSLN